MSGVTGDVHGAGERSERNIRGRGTTASVRRGATESRWRRRSPPTADGQLCGDGQRVGCDGDGEFQFDEYGRSGGEYRGDGGEWAKRDGEYGVCGGAAGDGDGWQRESGERSDGDVHGAGKRSERNIHGRSGDGQYHAGSNGIAVAPTFTANGTTGSYIVTASAAGVTAAASFGLTNTTGTAANIGGVRGQFAKHGSEHRFCDRSAGQGDR